MFCRIRGGYGLFPPNGVSQKERPCLRQPQEHHVQQSYTPEPRTAHPALGAVGGGSHHHFAAHRTRAPAPALPAHPLRRPAPWRGSGAGRQGRCGRCHLHGARAGGQRPRRAPAYGLHAPHPPHPEPARSRRHGRGIPALRPGLRAPQILRGGKPAGAGQRPRGPARPALRTRP